MKYRLFLFVFLAALFTGSPVSAAYVYSEKITIDHTKVGSSDSSNFPMLFYGTYAALATVANGGNVQHTATFNGQTVATDLIFTSDSAGSTLLSWDFASYNATTGQVEVWVKIPTLSHTANTVIYLFAGNAAISTYQGGAVGAAWDANFTAVYHLANGSTLSYVDSTANGFTLTNSVSAPTAGTGQIDGAMAVAHASTQYAYNNSASLPSPAAVTISGWIKGTSFPSAYNGAMAAQSAATDVSPAIYVKSNGKLAVYEWTSNSAFVDYDGSGTNTLSTGTLYYVAASYNSSGGLIGYVNGAVDGTAAANGTGYTGGISAIYAGWDSVSGRTFDGLVDEVHFSKSVRSADWITAEYNNQSSPATFYTLSSTGTVVPRRR